MKTLVSGLSESQVEELSDLLVGTKDHSKLHIFKKLNAIIKDSDKVVYIKILADLINFVGPCICCGCFTKIDCLDIDHICEACNQEDICSGCNEHELDCVCEDYAHGFEDEDFEDAINDEINDWDGDEGW